MNMKDGKVNKELHKVNRILCNENYQNNIKKIKMMEKDRKFCKHDLEHFMDTARIAYILNLERGLNIDKEIIYATGLLHDIGKWKQYKDGTPHHISSADISCDILDECEFLNEEKEEIIKAILNHRNKDVKYDDTLSGIIYCGDKLSRNCYDCKSHNECNWSDEKKNLFIKY